MDRFNTDMPLHDRKLPQLASALDDRNMKNVLSRHVGAVMAGNGIVSVQHEILKHTTGKRCVIQYSLNSTAHAATSIEVIGKLYRKNRGEKIFENMLNLWSVANAEEQPFNMPKPLTYLPDPGMVVQELVSGRSLFDLVGERSFVSGVKLVARNMARLHRLSVPGLKARTMKDHIKKYCRPGPDVLMSAEPTLAPLVEHILAYLLENQQLRNQPLCPVHGDLGLKQILIAEDHAFFVDFDGLSRSHAALDVAHFLVTLKIYLGQRADELAEMFLDTYLHNGGAEMPGSLNPYKTFAYLRRAMICFRTNSGIDSLTRVRTLLEAGHETVNETVMEAAE